MGKFIVEGGNKLSGNIEVSGNKNEVLPLISAALICDKPIKFSNVPKIGDVIDMLDIISKLGADVSPLRNGKVIIDGSNINSSLLPYALSSRIRGSILLASSLLIKTGKVILPHPGGDTIGRRRIDTHFHVFKALGSTISIKNEKNGTISECLTYTIKAPNGLKGTEIYLDEASVTATENAIIAASRARGVTTIANAASEPHVQGLCRFLNTVGVCIEGVGSNILTVYGTEQFKAAEFKISSDYIEAGSLISLAACTQSELTITNIDIEFMRMILFQFSRLGIEVETSKEKRTIRIPEKQTLKVKNDLGGVIPRIEDSPWPGFPADLTSIMVVTATQSKGTCLIHEKMFESRLFFVDKLLSMRAQIVLCDPHRVVVVGPSRLYGSTMTSPDIRAGMALLIAALAAEGTSVIQNISQIDRGYFKIDERLRSLGANISRTDHRRRKSDIREYFRNNK
ncbi:MAG: UDP-N-acetylglucosamine 1-carboxyvinyltransferase [Chitinispirillia bacterium]|jgi:UDP-N-acetylglucosamine 1-carboxyvinyltransferase